MFLLSCLALICSLFLAAAPVALAARGTPSPAELHHEVESALLPIALVAIFAFAFVWISLVILHRRLRRRGPRRTRSGIWIEPWGGDAGGFPSSGEGGA